MKNILTLPHDAVFCHLWNPGKKKLNGILLSVQEDWVESSKIKKYSPHTPQPTLPPKWILLRWFHFNFKLKTVDEADLSDEAVDATEANKAKANDANKAYEAKATEADKAGKANLYDEAVYATEAGKTDEAKANEADKAADANMANKAFEANKAD